MGFFGSLIGGVTSLISGGKNRKNDARNRESSEKLAMMQAESEDKRLAAAQEQRAHEARMQAGGTKNNKKGFIPYIIGGGVGLLAIIGVIIGTKKKRR